jgi:hypothetical protein
MQIGCTKILYEQMNMTPEALGNTAPLYAWHANIFTLHRRKAVLLTHDVTRFPILLYGLKVAHWKQMDRIIEKAIHSALKSEWIRPEVIQAFLQDGGEISFTKTSDRSVLSAMSQMIEAIKCTEEDKLDSENLYQGEISDQMGEWIFKLHGKYRSPREVLREVLTEKYGAGPDGNNASIYSLLAFQCRITLDLDNHDVWRRLIIPANITFRKLHYVIQDAFGWLSYHLYRFDFTEKGKIVAAVCLNPYPDFPSGEEDCISEADDQVMLSKYLPRFRECTYEYDFGDGWTHTVEIEKIIGDYDDVFPVCIGGAGNCPPEDVGGEGGYDEFLEAIRNPKHPEHREMIDWGKSQQYAQFDLSNINSKLYRSFRRSD